jgi:polyhydroxyalkanoate synthesis regulator protein
MAGQILYLITRYGRPRVYHPASGGYVSSEGLAGDIDDLRQWQREGVAFVVIDTETGADVTRVLLA